MAKADKRKGWKKPDAGAYLPTPDEIRAACKKIQEGWNNQQEIDKQAEKCDQVETRVHAHPGRFERRGLSG